MNALAILFFLGFQQADRVLDDSLYFQAHRNAAPCAAAGTAGCGTRIVVALGDITLNGSSMKRGDLRVFGASESYLAPTGGSYVEVAVKPGHPAVVGPSIEIEPPGNDTVFDNDELDIYEEKLEVGATRPRHGHRERTVIQLNATLLEITPDGGEPLQRPQVPDTVGFRNPVVHVAKNMGPSPLRNIVIELKK